MRPVIAGTGNMGAEVRQLCNERNIDHSMITDPDPRKPPDILIYVGSKDRFPDSLAYAERWDIPVLQCASDVVVPEQVPVPVIDTPNATLEMVIFNRMVHDMAVHLPDEKRGKVWQLWGSHQKSKKTISASEMYLINALEIPPENVESQRVRDEVHGSVRLHAGYRGLVMDFHVHISGRRHYAEGMLYWAEAIIHRRKMFSRRVYPVIELLDLIKP